MHAHTFSAHVWFDVGLSTNNTRRYVDVTTIAQGMGSVLFRYVAALHAFTGCDFTASFMRKGKLRPLALMIKNETWQAAFAELGESSNLSSKLITDLENCVCCI